MDFVQVLIHVNIGWQHTRRRWINASVQFADFGSALFNKTCLREGVGTSVAKF